MQDPTRPDPDALLAQMRNDEARALRGKLRIYFDLLGQQTREQKPRRLFVVYD